LNISENKERLFSKEIILQQIVKYTVQANELVQIELIGTFPGESNEYRFQLQYLLPQREDGTFAVAALLVLLRC